MLFVVFVREKLCVLNHKLFNQIPSIFSHKFLYIWSWYPNFTLKIVLPEFESLFYRVVHSIPLVSSHYAQHYWTHYFIICCFSWCHNCGVWLWFFYFRANIVKRTSDTAYKIGLGMRIQLGKNTVPVLDDMLVTDLQIPVPLCIDFRLPS